MMALAGGATWQPTEALRVSAFSDKSNVYGVDAYTAGDDTVAAVVCGETVTVYYVPPDGPMTVAVRWAGDKSEARREAAAAGTIQVRPPEELYCCAFNQSATDPTHLVLAVAGGGAVIKVLDCHVGIAAAHGCSPVKPAATPLAAAAAEVTTAAAAAASSVPPMSARDGSEAGDATSAFADPAPFVRRAAAIAAIRAIEGGGSAGAKVEEVAASGGEPQPHVPTLAMLGMRGELPGADVGVIAALAGHGSAIYDIAWHPRSRRLLLSASKDQSLRLWDAYSHVMVALFGGPSGHAEDVLALSPHPLGTCVATSGFDHSVKVWALDSEEVHAAIATAATWTIEDRSATAFPTALVHEPVFSTGKVHSEYVDAVRWVGGRNILLSKCGSNISHKLVLWEPALPPDPAVDPGVIPPASSRGHAGVAPDGDATLLCEYVLDKCEPWFTDMALSPDLKTLAVACEEGRVTLFRTFGTMFDGPGAGGEASGPSDAAGTLATTAVALARDVATFLVLPVAVLGYPGVMAQVRSVAFTPDGQSLLAGCDGGYLVRWDLREGPARIDTFPSAAGRSSAVSHRRTSAGGGGGGGSGGTRAAKYGAR